MKMLFCKTKSQDKAQVIARFGKAHLVRRHKGILELCDASPEQKVEACEWISLFSHDALLHTGNPVVF